MNLTTDAELAEQFGITLEKFHRLRRLRGWPCVKIGRFNIRFTDEQVAQIVAMHSERTSRATVVGPVSGQTKRSASRRKSA